MHYAQSFSSPAVLDRVCHWLVRLGFRPAELHIRSDHRPSLFVTADWARAESIQQIVDAVVNSAPHGVPSGWDSPTGPTPPPEFVAAHAVPVARGGASPIHWEPREAPCLARPE